MLLMNFCIRSFFAGLDSLVWASLGAHIQYTDFVGVPDFIGGIYHSCCLPLHSTTSHYTVFLGFAFFLQLTGSFGCGGRWGVWLGKMDANNYLETVFRTVELQF